MSLLPHPPQFGEPQALPPQIEADVAAVFRGMPLSTDYIWRGFLGRHPPAPAPHAAPAPTGAGGRARLHALALSPGPAREEPPRAWATAAAASPARPTPGWPSPRPGLAIGRGGERGRGAGPGGGTGARLCGGRGPRRPGAARSALRSQQERIFCAPPPPPPITWILSVEGWDFFFFFGSLPLHPTEDLRLGYNRGGGCRARGVPPPPPRPAHTSLEPWKAQPPVPPEEAAAVSLPLSPAWHPGLGRTRGRWVPRPSGLRGVRGAAAWGTGGSRSWEVAPGSARLSRDPALDACLGCHRPPRRRGGLHPAGPLPGSQEGRVGRGGGMGARRPPTSLMPGPGN